MTNNKELEKEIITAERITIDYANLSGRESSNRAEFRERVIKHLQSYAEKVRRQAYGDGYKQGKFDAKMRAEYGDPLSN